jgi:hypothetical protein
LDAPGGAEDIDLSDESLNETMTRAEVVFFLLKFFGLELSPAPNGALYLDVSDAYPYKDVLHTAIINDIAHGYGYKGNNDLQFGSFGFVGYEDYQSREFKPELSPTRAESLKLIIETLKIRILLDNPSQNLLEAFDFSSNPFRDLPEEAWYSKYILFSKKFDIVSGYPDGTFKPDHQITKGELIALFNHLMDFRAEHMDIIQFKMEDLLPSLNSR